MSVALLSVKIRGIRSYSPQEEAEQNIEFMPLTLIVGSNGTGKTTLIESLKFIIAGEEPPLSDCRRNFIHTPKSNQRSRIASDKAGSVELEFTDTEGRLCVAKRVLSQPSQGKTPSISSSYKVGPSRWQSVNKQDDWNKTLPKLFNLQNKAILDNVILCHQEENLWFFNESSKVKEVFDKIFGCDAYKKELRYIDKEIKSTKADISCSERELHHAQEKLKRKRSLMADLQYSHKRLNELKTDSEILDTKIKTAVDRKNVLANDLSEFEAQSRCIDTLETRISGHRVQLKSLQESLKNPLLPSNVVDEYLESKPLEIRNSEQKITDSKKREEVLSKDIRDLESEKKKLQSEINETLALELKSKQSQKELIMRLEEIKSDHNIEEIDTSDIRSCLKVLRAKEAEFLRDKSNMSEIDDSSSKDLFQLTKTLSETEGNRLGLSHKITSKESIVKQLSDKLAEADPIAKDLTAVTENFKRMNIIADDLPVSEPIKSLKDLIDQSNRIVVKLINKIGKEEVAKLTTQINKERTLIENCKREEESSAERQAKLRIELDEKRAEQAKARISAKDAHNKAIVFKTALQNLLHINNVYETELTSLEKQNVDLAKSKIEELSLKIESMRSQSGSLVNERSETYEKVKQLEQELQELKLSKQIYVTSSELDSMVSSLEAMRAVEFSDKLVAARLELREIEERISELREKRSMNGGSYNQLSIQVEKFTRELTFYERAFRDNSELLGRVYCMKLVLSDLNKLKNCFETSVRAFHDRMMKRINEVLRTRWRWIYQGGDIDHIELVAEEMTKSGDKKTYNYYIAMSKAGTRMKMREKSSAGQKALASIILRITLAELFVKDFAFVALDEPTSNLDHANVRSLAKAIGTYVTKRSKKGLNIQWIIITHDEYFIRALDVECSPYFYRTKLDISGYSKIEKCSLMDAQQSNHSSLSTESNSNFSTQRTGLGQAA